MKKGRMLIIVCYICSVSLCFSQEIYPFSPTEESMFKPVDYVFSVYDGTLDSYTMRQFINYETCFSSLFSRSVDSVAGNIILKNTSISLIPKCLATISYQILTHEEAHRSILTALKIGSISQPFFNERGGACVTGVSNSTLQNIRDTNLPMFIRLHTAGLESDYSISNKKIEKMCLKTEEAENIFLSQIGYMTSSMTYQFSGIIDFYLGTEKNKSGEFDEEEENELERDIVGHDVYGMARHLFRSDMEYKRYTTFDQLTNEEKEFVKRIGWKSLINFIQPFYIMGWKVFQINNGISFSGSAGYCIAPFGDFIDENIYFKYDKFNISFYARQAQNRYTWFPAFGLGLVEYKPVDWFSATVRGHFWMQPENLDFNTTVGVPGGAGEVSLNFIFPNKNEGPIKGMGINIGALYKTAGFLPEIESHDAHFRMSAGLVVRY